MTAQRSILLVLAFALMSCTTAQTPRPIAVEELTVEEKIAQMFVAEGFGRYMSSTSASWKRLDSLVREKRVGGFVWFLSNVYELAELNRRLQKISKVPLLISADLEAGMGMRFVDTWYWPPAMAVGATGDPALAERQGRQIAREARAVGINHILAPVADVNVNPDNTVINARSYGEDPARVGEFVAALVRGIRAEGLLATAKHFPGHGDTHTDSHRALPQLDVDRARLEAVELGPFRAAIEAGVDSVMMGHLAVPSVDPTPAPLRPDAAHHNAYQADASELPENATVPATLSRAMIDGLLRKELGFRGLVITDAMDMGGLTAHFDPGEAAVRAIEAGEDQILMSTDIDAAMKAVREAVASGRLSEGRIDDSVRRILEAKRRVPHTVASIDEIFDTVDAAASRALASEIASRAITLVREARGALPLTRTSRVTFLSISDFPDPVPPLADFERELRTRLTTPPRTFVLDPRSPDSDIAAANAAARDADVVILGLAIRARSGSGRLALPPSARTLLESLQALPAPRIAIAFGTPYLLRELPFLETYLCAYGPQPPLQIAAAKALFGEAPITGKLPVTIPGLHARGEGIERK